MKLRFTKYPVLAFFALCLTVLSTSCNKETDLVSEFVITERSTSMDSVENNNSLADIEALEDTTK